MTEKKTCSESELKNTNGNVTENLKSRRGAVKALVVGGGVVAGSSAIPAEWAKPIVNAVVLPGHAQTTDAAVSMSSVSAVSPVADNDSFDMDDILDVFVSKAYAAGGLLIGSCVKLTVEGAVATVELTLNDSMVDTKTGTIIGGTDVMVSGLHGIYVLTGTLDSATAPTSSTGTISGSGETGNYGVSITGGSCSPVAPTTTTTAAPTTTTTTTEL